MSGGEEATGDEDGGETADVCGRDRRSAQVFALRAE